MRGHCRAFHPAIMAQGQGHEPRKNHEAAKRSDRQSPVLEIVPDPTRAGPAIPPTLPIELMSAIPPAAAVPVRSAVGSVQNAGSAAKVPTEPNVKATIAMTGSPR